MIRTNRPEAGLPLVTLLTPEDVASLLAVPVTTITEWRDRGINLPVVKVGRNPRYHPEDVRLYVNAHRHQPSVQAAMGEHNGR